MRENTKQTLVIKPSQQKLKLINAALDDLFQNGIVLNSTRVAERCNLKRPIVNYQFGSREGMVNYMYDLFQQKIDIELKVVYSSKRAAKNMLYDVWRKRIEWGIGNSKEIRFLIAMFTLRNELNIVNQDNEIMSLLNRVKKQSSFSKYSTIELATLFYAGNNLTILSLLAYSGLFKDSAKLINRSYESFILSLNPKDESIADSEFSWRENQTGYLGFRQS